MAELAAWFVQQSIFTEDKAISITCRLDKELWIDSLVLLRDGLKHDPGNGIVWYGMALHGIR